MRNPTCLRKSGRLLVASTAGVPVPYATGRSVRLPDRPSRRPMVPWFKHSSGRVWAGLHGSLGPIVFDPNDQDGVPGGYVRFFLATKGYCSLLPRGETRRRIDSRFVMSALQKAVDTYCASKPSGRPNGPMSVPRRTDPQRVMPVDQGRRVDSLPPCGVSPRDCERCGWLIPLTRLEAMPDTTLCIRCQADAETRPGGVRRYEVGLSCGTAIGPRPTRPRRIAACPTRSPPTRPSRAGPGPRPPSRTGSRTSPATTCSASSAAAGWASSTRPSNSSRPGSSR